jgi:hypothetical protein
LADDVRGEGDFRRKTWSDRRFLTRIDKAREAARGFGKLGSPSSRAIVGPQDAGKMPALQNRIIRSKRYIYFIAKVKARELGNFLKIGHEGGDALS